MKERAGGTGRVSRDAGASRDSGERREQMLQAALDVIVERGYADTRIADVGLTGKSSPVNGRAAADPGLVR